MFHNIGKKIRNLATIFCWAGIVASFNFGLVFLLDKKVGLGLVVMLGGALFSWIGSFILYGFGELIQDTAEIKAKLTGESISSPEKKRPAPVSTNSGSPQTALNTKPEQQSCPTKCDICDKMAESIAYVKIQDNMGIRFRNMCPDCMMKYHSNGSIISKLTDD